MFSLFVFEKHHYFLCGNHFFALPTQQLFLIFFEKIARNEKMESDFEKNLKSLKKKLSLYRQEVPEIFSGHMDRQRFLIKMS